MSPHRETVREELGALGGSYNSGQYIARQLDEPIGALRSAAANSTHQARFARLERLEMSLQDTEQLIAIGRVGFDGDWPQRSAVSGPTVSLLAGGFPIRSPHPPLRYLSHRRSIAPVGQVIDRQRKAFVPNRIAKNIGGPRRICPQVADVPHDCPSRL
jgi:hypothetical protein